MPGTLLPTQLLKMKKPTFPKQHHLTWKFYFLAYLVVGFLNPSLALLLGLCTG